MIVPRRFSKCCAKHQREVSRVIKQVLIADIFCSVHANDMI
jgi:ribosomal protein S18